MSKEQFHGAGVYDDACTVAREMTNAKVCMTIIMGGSKGSGFSVQATSPDYIQYIPTILETMAEQIRQENKARG